MDKTNQPLTTKDYRLQLHNLTRLSSLFFMVSNGGSHSDQISGCTVNQARIFGYIITAGESGTRIKALAHDLDVSCAAASKAVDRLVAAQLVERKPDPTDHRAVCVTLSKKGRDRIAFMEESYNALMNEFLMGYSDSDKEIFFSIVNKIFTGLVAKWKAILEARDATKPSENNLK